MRATARVRVEAGDGAGRAGVRGSCRVVELVSAAPLALRSDRAGTVWLVGSAAGPLGGDELTLQVDVGPGARVAIRSVAAQLVLPGPPDPSPSALPRTGEAEARVRIEATVAAGGHLDWCPEPTVVAAGAHLRQVATVEVAAGGTLRWREVVVLGRHGEGPGRVSARLDVDYAGRPLLRHELVAGPGAPAGWDGPAGLAGARAVAAELVAGDGAGAVESRPGSCRGDGAVTLPLEDDGALTLVAAPDARAAIDALATAPGPSVFAQPRSLG